MLGCLRVVVKTCAVDKMGVFHSQFCRPSVHFFHKCRFAASKVLRHSAGAVVGRGYGDGLYHI